MYRISTKDHRKYSPNPIVKVTVDEEGKEHEDVVLIACNMKKAEGDILSKKVVELLNAEEERTSIKPWHTLMEDELRKGAILQALKIYKDNTGCSLQEGKEFIMSIKDNYKS